MKNRRVSPYKLYFGVLFSITAIFGVALYSVPNIQKIWIYPIAINLASFVLCWYDKMIAASNRVRVPELVLLTSALIGGSAGLLIGMKLFRHKTIKASFQFWLVVVLATQVFLVYYFLTKFNLTDLSS
jgi:uncharacterized membrane protein YsdA (DUF1294 family)